MKIQSKYVADNGRVESLEERVTALETKIEDINKVWQRVYAGTIIVMVVVIAIQAGMS